MITTFFIVEKQGSGFLETLTKTARGEVFSLGLTSRLLLVGFVSFNQHVP